MPLHLFGQLCSWEVPIPIIWEFYVVLTLLILVICEWSDPVGWVGLVGLSDWMRMVWFWQEFLRKVGRAESKEMKCVIYSLWISKIGNWILSTSTLEVQISWNSSELKCYRVWETLLWASRLLHYRLVWPWCSSTKADMVGPCRKVRVEDVSPSLLNMAI